MKLQVKTLILTLFLGFLLSLGVSNAVAETSETQQKINSTLD